MPRYTVRAGPGRNLYIPAICPAVAGFLVRPERRDSLRAPDILKHLDRLTGSDNQGLAKAAKIV